MSIPVGEFIITNGQDPLTGEWFTGTRRIPFYGCGHCSRPIAFRSDRVRPREICRACDRYLCEKTAACMKGCTPIYALAADKWEADGKWTEHLPEIMGIEPEQVTL